MLDRLAFSLMNFPWMIPALHSVGGAVYRELTSKSITNDESKDKTNKNSFKESAFFAIKNVIYPIASCSLWNWSMSAKLKEIWEKTGLQANLEDPRKLMVVLRAKFKDKEKGFKDILNIQIARWKEDFDFVMEEVDSVAKIDKVIKRITHIGDKIKPISLLFMHAHGSAQEMMLTHERSISWNSALTKDTLRYIDWEGSLEKSAKVVMLSCSTGAGENSFAGHFANITHRSVIAPGDRVTHFFKMNYSPDLSSIDMRYTTGAPDFDTSGDLMQIPGKVFQPGQSGSVSSTDYMKTWSLYRQHIEGSGYNYGMMTTSELVNIYIMLTMAAGVYGYGLKASAYIGKRIFGDRIAPITTFMNKLGSGMTGFFNFNFGVVANVASALYNGTEKAYNYMKPEVEASDAKTEAEEEVFKPCEKSKKQQKLLAFREIWKQRCLY